VQPASTPAPAAQPAPVKRADSAIEPKSKPAVAASASAAAAAPPAPAAASSPATATADSLFGESPGGDGSVDSLFGAPASGMSDFLVGDHAPAPTPAINQPAANQPAAAPVPVPVPVTMPLVSQPVPPNPVLDGAVKRAVIVGNFEAAVDLCLKFGRLADALLLAATGGRELFQRTQDRLLHEFSHRGVVL
jgi:protein transport protein SEC31